MPAGRSCSVTREGIGDWRNLALAAKTVGGAQYYLVEQEGSRISPMETAQKCLENFYTLTGRAS